jgi:hypothetical protein
LFASSRIFIPPEYLLKNSSWFNLYSGSFFLRLKDGEVIYFGRKMSQMTKVGKINKKAQNRNSARKECWKMNKKWHLNF